MIWNYIKIALRNLHRNKLFSAINISGLSLGLTVAMLITLYGRDEVRFDTFHQNQSNIYRVVCYERTQDGSIENRDPNTGDFPGPKFKEHVPGIEAFVRIKGVHMDFEINHDMVGYELLQVDDSFFSVFSFPVIAGNANTALKGPNSLVLSESRAQEWFGTTAVIGKIVKVKENDMLVPYEITAVTQNGPQNSSIKFDMLMPYQEDPKASANQENWFNFFLNTFVVLNPTLEVAKVESNMNAFFEKDSKDALKIAREKYNFKNDLKFKLQPITAMHLSTDYPVGNGLKNPSNPTYSYILSSIAIFLLIIACINSINLTIGRSIKRAKEIGVRKVVGGSKRQLIYQFLGESFVVCFLSFVVAIVLTLLLLPTFNRFTEKNLAFDYLLDTQLIVIYIAIFVITGFLSGFYPAFVIAKFKPVETLYGRIRYFGQAYLQKGLVVTQFAIASFFVIATITIFSQFHYLTTSDLGYNDKNIVVLTKWGLTHSEAKLLKHELLKNPNIEGVTFKNSGWWSTLAKVNETQNINFAVAVMDMDYLSLLDIPLIKGRGFSKEFPADSTASILVNEAFVKEAQWNNPIGQEINFYLENNTKYQVIGVVKNYHDQGINLIEPKVFTTNPKNNFGDVLIKVSAGSMAATLPFIEQVYKNRYPLNPYNYSLLEENNLDFYKAEANWKQIMLFAAILTIFISCIGLLGLVILSSENRTKEISIRKIVGASVSSLVTLLSKDLLKLVTISLLVSLPIGFYCSKKWIENYPYRIDLGWQTFVLTITLTLSIAMLTVGWYALKIAKRNPIKSLRTE